MNVEKEKARRRRRNKKIGRSDVDVKMLKGILNELVLIRKELQAIRDIMESSSKICIDGTKMAKAVQKAIHDTTQATLNSSRNRNH